MIWFLMYGRVRCAHTVNFLRNSFVVIFGTNFTRPSCTMLIPSLSPALR